MGNLVVSATNPVVTATTPGYGGYFASLGAAQYSTTPTSTISITVNYILSTMQTYASTLLSNSGVVTPANTAGTVYTLPNINYAPLNAAITALNSIGSTGGSSTTTALEDAQNAYIVAFVAYQMQLAIYNNILTDTTINWGVSSCGTDPTTGSTTSGNCTVNQAAITYCTCCVGMLQALITEDTLKYQAYQIMSSSFSTITSAYSAISTIQQALLLAGQYTTYPNIWINNSLFNCAQIPIQGLAGAPIFCDTVVGTGNWSQSDASACSSCSGGNNQCNCNGSNCPSCAAGSSYLYNSDASSSTYNTTYQAWLSNYTNPGNCCTGATGSCTASQYCPVVYNRVSSYPNVLCQACTQCQNLNGNQAGGALTITNISQANNCIANMNTANNTTTGGTGSAGSGAPTLGNAGAGGSGAPTLGNAGAGGSGAPTLGNAGSGAPSLNNTTIPPPLPPPVPAPASTPFYETDEFIIFIVLLVIVGIIGTVWIIYSSKSHKGIPLPARPVSMPASIYTPRQSVQPEPIYAPAPPMSVAPAPIYTPVQSVQPEPIYAPARPVYVEPQMTMRPGYMQ